MARYDNIFDCAIYATAEEASENWPLISSYAKTVSKESGNTPLHYAAMYNPDTAVMSSLIMYGAKVNVKNKEGKTPLDVASTEEKKKFLRPHAEGEERAKNDVACCGVVLIFIIITAVIVWYCVK